MTVTKDDFEKIWASTSPLTPYSFSESQYKEGWNFIGSTPPSRQMWDFLQKQNDEKSQYLFNNFDNYLPLSGGTLTGDVFGVTPPNGDNSKKIANTEFIQALASILVPVGCVQAYAGSTLPTGWLLCDGSAVSRTDYAALYAVIGTTYGAGDGSTTFNLPNLVNRMAVGSGSSYAIAATGGEASHKLTEAELPALSGEAGMYTRYKDDQTASGVLKESYGSYGRFPSSAAENCTASVVKIAFGGNQPHNNMPPYLALRYIIKY